MVVILTAMAMATPSLRNWNRGQQQRDTVDQILALTRYAKSQAAANATTYRLNVEAPTGRYWLTMQDGQEFVQIGKDLGQVFELPAGMKLELLEAEGAATITTVDFYSTGRSQTARLRLTNQIGDVTDIACLAPAQGFAVQTGDVQRQRMR
jgi:Tfp pilus assembly protein FimT